MRSTPVSISDWLEYSAVGGRELGLALHEYETSLRVDLKAGVAFLEDHQPTTDKGGEPLGTSRAVVPIDLMDQLRELLDATDLASIPRSQRAGQGRSSMIVRRSTDGIASEAAFSNRDLDVLRDLGPLLSTLDDIVAFVAETPYQAVRFALEPLSAKAASGFSVKVTNVGSEAVLLPDLGALARTPIDQPDHWFGVRVAEYPEPSPGYTPPPFHWVRVELLAPSTPGRPLTLFEPGAELTFRTAPPKKMASGVRHLVQAVFSSYAGEAVVDGRVVIRGRALSTALRWVPP
jgi:hypothetical protein